MKHYIFMTDIAILYLDEHFFFINFKVTNFLVHTFVYFVRPF